MNELPAGGNLKVLELLLQHGADVQRIHNGTALHKAATWYREDMIRSLLQAGADITADCNGTPLMWCKVHAPPVHLCLMLLSFIYVFFFPSSE
jgi:ankyrin repeat protein